MNSRAKEDGVREFQMVAGTQSAATSETTVLLVESGGAVENALHRTVQEIQSLTAAVEQGTEPRQAIPAQPAGGAAAAGTQSQIQALPAASRLQPEAVSTNTGTVAANATTQSSDNKKQSTAGRVGDIAKTVSPLGLGQLVAGIISLFDNGSDDQPAPLVKYTPPPPVRIQAANTREGILDADYGPNGTVRPYAGSAAASLGAAPQVVVQVQAMDSRSFMDHSVEIAQAVREAMLNMHAINDVVADL